MFEGSAELMSERDRPAADGFERESRRMKRNLPRQLRGQDVRLPGTGLSDKAPTRGNTKTIRGHAVDGSWLRGAG